jgi:hypothetical protein
MSFLSVLQMKYACDVWPLTKTLFVQTWDQSRAIARAVLRDIYEINKEIVSWLDNLSHQNIPKDYQAGKEK